MSSNKDYSSDSTQKAEPLASPFRKRGNIRERELEQVVSSNKVDKTNRVGQIRCFEPMITALRDKSIKASLYFVVPYNKFSFLFVGYAKAHFGAEHWQRKNS